MELASLDGEIDVGWLGNGVFVSFKPKKKTARIREKSQSETLEGTKKH